MGSLKLGMDHLRSNSFLLVQKIPLLEHCPPHSEKTWVICNQNLFLLVQKRPFLEHFPPNSEKEHGSFVTKIYDENLRERKTSLA